MSGGGAQLTIHTTPWQRQRAELAARYGTDDIEEAIRREMAQEELGEVLGTTKDEILHNKLEEMKRMSKRTCEWEGCDASIEGTHSRTRYCEDHKGPAAEKARQSYRAKHASSKPRKPKSACAKCLRENCDERGQRDTCTRFTLTGGKRSVPPVNPPAAEDPRPVPEDYRPPIEPANPLLDAFDRFQADCRKIFIARQKQHGKSSILDVTLEDLVGVHRLKGARIKQQVKMGVSYPEVFHDSLIDNAVYCFILWAVSTGEWEKLEWKEVA